MQEYKKIYRFIGEGVCLLLSLSPYREHTKRLCVACRGLYGFIQAKENKKKHDKKIPCFFRPFRFTNLLFFAIDLGAPYKPFREGI